jgi:hypothetical protein
MEKAWISTRPLRILHRPLPSLRQYPAPADSCPRLTVIGDVGVVDVDPSSVVAAVADPELAMKISTHQLTDREQSVLAPSCKCHPHHTHDREPAGTARQRPA